MENRMKITRTELAAMTLVEFRVLHPTTSMEILEAMYDDRLVAFDEVLDESIGDDETEYGACTVCGGLMQILGTLGQRTHARCRNCGAEASTIAN